MPSKDYEEPAREIVWRDGKPYVVYQVPDGDRQKDAGYD